LGDGVCGCRQAQLADEGAVQLKDDLSVNAVLNRQILQEEGESSLLLPEAFGM
jgi:hypothetical protein